MKSMSKPSRRNWELLNVEKMIHVVVTTPWRVNIHCNMILPPTWVSWVVSSILVSEQKCDVYFLYLPWYYMHFLSHPYWCDQPNTIWQEKSFVTKSNINSAVLLGIDHLFILTSVTKLSYLLCTRTSEWVACNGRGGWAVNTHASIWEVQISNLGAKTGYPDWSFPVFSSVPPEKCGTSLKLGHDCFFLLYLQFIIHVSSFHLTLYSLSYWKIVNKLHNNNRSHVPKYCNLRVLKAC
jgi:hypothetical protein